MKGIGRSWLRVECRSFVRAAEEFLASHPGAVTYTPARLASHLERCRRCLQRWQSALASRELLTSLRSEGELAADPYFYSRLRTRIGAMRRRSGMAEIRWLHLALAMALFFVALGSFAYNLHRTETPNADEAMALDVPHINPQHPADSHAQPRLADAMLNLMNP
ncbi:MAG: hypothetical protein ACRD0Y_01785 [Terriglobales bacterium]